MFCKNCGKELDVDAKFCVECGTSVANMTFDYPNSNQSKTNDNGEKETRLPPVTKLKGYKSTEKCLCLECGYNGPMGVIGYKYSGFIRYGVPVIVLVVLYVLVAIIEFLLNGMGIVLSGFGIISWNILPAFLTIMAFWKLNSYKYLYCPNCDSKLLKK